MKRLTIAMCLLLSACDKPLTNEQVIAMTKQCKAAGLVAREFPGITWRTTDIQCQQPIYH